MIFDKYDNVMGIDCSTNSLAFAIFNNECIVKYGEIQFVGKDVYHRAADAKNKLQALKDEFSIGYIAIEKTIMVRSIDTAIKMAFVAGTVISCLMDNNIKVVEIAPITWQGHIGNPNLSLKEKNSIKIMFPNKSKSWYQNKNREVRKQKTIDWVKSNFGLDIESNNITDAIGLAYYASCKVGNKS